MGFAGAIELWDDRTGLPAGRARPQRQWWYFNIRTLLRRRRHRLERGARHAAHAVVAQLVAVVRHSWTG